MIESQPKSSTMISIGVILSIILGVDIWLFYELVQNPDAYLIVKLILTPTLLVIAITIARKAYSTALRVTIGNNKLTYSYLFGTKKSHKISDVTSWYEEVVKSKKDEYKRLTIVVKNGKALLISNKENTNYQSIVNYLSKKIKKLKAQ